MLTAPFTVLSIMYPPVVYVNSHIGYTRLSKIKQKQKHNIICVGHHYAQTNINNVNRTWALMQTTGGRGERT